MIMKSEIIQAILDQQLNGSDIARKFGVSRQYVGQLAAQIGIKPRRKQAKPPYQRKQKVNDPLAEQKRKYKNHKRLAERRGIEFLLTFNEWWAIWEPNYNQRGRNKGQMCMCRTLDSGPYAVGNVRIDYVESNGHEKISSRIYKRGTQWKARAGADSSGVAEALGFRNKHDCFRDPAEILECKQEGLDIEP